MHEQLNPSRQLKGIGKAPEGERPMTPVAEHGMTRETAGHDDFGAGRAGNKFDDKCHDIQNETNMEEEHTSKTR